MGLRPGCMGVLRRAAAAGVPTHVISVNWSSELVRAALQQPAVACTPDSNGDVRATPADSMCQSPSLYRTNGTLLVYWLSAMIYSCEAFTSMHPSVTWLPLLNLTICSRARGQTACQRHSGHGPRSRGGCGGPRRSANPRQ